MGNQPSHTARKASRKTRTSVQTAESSHGAAPSSRSALSLAYLELAPDAILVVDPTGHIIEANRQVEVLFGYARTDILGRPVETLVPERFRAVHQQHRASYATTPYTRQMGLELDLFGRRHDGSEFPLEVSLSPLQFDNEPLVICSIRDITERKRLKQAHAAALRQLQLQAELIERAHDAILVRDLESRIVSWNHGAEQTYGWTASHAIGQFTHSLLMTQFPRSLEAVNAQLTRVGEWDGELQHTARDGRTVIVESRQVLIRDEQGSPSAILEINRNITMRKRLEEAEHAAHRVVEGQRALLQRVLDELPGGAYLVHGREARLMLVNRAAEAVWGAHWAVGQPMAAFLNTSGVSYFAENGQPLTADELITLQIARGSGGQRALHRREVIQQPNGTRSPVLVNAVLIEALLLDQGNDQEASASRPRGIAGAPVDREPSTLVLLQDISAIQAAEQLKDEFVSVAAHELRTPLAAIHGFADMLRYHTALGRGPELADWQQEAITEIATATVRMNALVQDLLDATHIQAGQLALHPAPLELVGIVRRCLTQLQLTTTIHTLSVEAPEAPVLLAVDALRLEQVLSNLIGNAIKYSPEGGPITVTVQVDEKAQQAVVRIRDSGIGIPADEQAQLFQRFVRAHNVHDHHISGSGLGLYICRELVERQGGHLWFESVEGQGTTFFLTLPLLDPEVSARTETTETREAPPATVYAEETSHPQAIPDAKADAPSESSSQSATPHTRA